MCGKSRQLTRPLTQVPIHRAPEGGPASAPHPWPAVSSREKLFWRVRASAFQEKDSWSVFHGEVWVGGAGGTRHEDRELGTAVPWTPHCWTEISAAKLIKRVQWQRFLSSGISSSDVLSCLPLRELCQDAKGTREMVITVRHVGAYLSSQCSGGGAGDLKIWSHPGLHGSPCLKHEERRQANRKSRRNDLSTRPESL